MRKEIRRIIMFCTILTVGILLLTFDITFIQLLLFVVAIAIVMPFLLGLVTIAELREAFSSFKENTLKKVSILKKLDEIKLFEKKAPGKSPALPAKAAAPAKPATATDKKESKIPFTSHIQSLISSIGSLGTVLKERTKRERKVADINTMLDKTVKGEVPAPATAPAPAAGDASLPSPPGGAGSAEEDPFLSLSGDEFDDGLLDGLDDEGTGGLSDTMESPAGDGLPAAGMELPEPELTMPGAGGGPDESAELDAAASAILAAAGESDDGLDEFGSLESPDGAGADSELGDLDNISLDEIDIDADLDEEGETGGGAEPAEAAAAAEVPAGAPAAPATEPSGAVKTAWIPSDAPGDADMMQDQIGTQSDMAAFAGGAGGTDEDLLSSIASDVKTTVKKKDLSLLRELKDFKAPATQIESELTDMYRRLNAVKQKRSPTDTTNEIK